LKSFKPIGAKLQKLEAEDADFRARYDEEQEAPLFRAERDELKYFIREHNNNWWKLKNLSITIGLGFVGLVLIIVTLVNDFVIKGNGDIWSLLFVLLVGLVVYLAVEEAQKKFSQLEKFFTEMKNDIGRLKEQNTKLTRAISDLNDRLQKYDFNKGMLDSPG
jgi:hypothetical protein